MRGKHSKYGGLKGREDVMRAKIRILRMTIIGRVTKIYIKVMTVLNVVILVITMKNECC